MVQVHSTIVQYQCANIWLKVKMQIEWRIGGEDTKREMDMLVKANATTYFREEKDVTVQWP